VLTTSVLAGCNEKNNDKGGRQTLTDWSRVHHEQVCFPKPDESNSSQFAATVQRVNREITGYPELTNLKKSPIMSPEDRQHRENKAESFV
jgi:hypothetical protein